MPPSQHWQGSGQVFTKDGWIATTVLVVWVTGFTDYWCLITNNPVAQSADYAVRYGQVAGFRDLKSDGWQWHTYSLFRLGLRCTDALLNHTAPVARPFRAFSRSRPLSLNCRSVKT